VRRAVAKPGSPRTVTPEQVLDIAREAIFVLIKLGAPIMGVALVVGVLVALLQALTQMQEMTLSFVPKILAIFLTLILTLPFMIQTLTGFGEDMFRRIAGLG
jgi:flagellar biosynthetic protein FliQ